MDEMGSDILILKEMLMKLVHDGSNFRSTDAKLTVVEAQDILRQFDLPLTQINQVSRS